MPKFQKGERVRIHEKLFPSFDEGLFKGTAKTGTVDLVQEASILPYRVRMDGLGHHPFWFYENQLEFEDASKERAWAEANKPTVRGAAAKAEAHE